MQQGQGAVSSPSPGGPYTQNTGTCSTPKGAEDQAFPVYATYRPQEWRGREPGWLGVAAVSPKAITATLCVRTEPLASRRREDCSCIQRSCLVTRGWRILLHSSDMEINSANGREFPSKDLTCSLSLCSHWLCLPGDSPNICPGYIKNIYTLLFDRVVHKVVYTETNQ